MKNLTAIPKVSLLFATNEHAHREILRGILRYARSNGPWSLRIIEGRAGEESRACDASWPCSGIIGVMQNMPYARAVLDAKCPAVLIDPLDASSLPEGMLSRYSVLASDQNAIGNLAAETFLDRGFRHFAYVGTHIPINWSDARGRAFAQALEKKGFACPAFRGKNADLGDWLVRLPKPVAVFAAMDMRGRLVLDACAAAGLAVPQDVAVLAVDNDELICSTTFPTLSSILLDTEHMGYEAARLLDSLLRGECRHRAARLFPPIRVKVRESTDVIRFSDEAVRRALEFIFLNAKNLIGVPEVAAASGISRRRLEARFQHILHKSILDALQETRLSRVQAMLSETNFSIAAIARASGFANESYLGKVFRKKFKISMSEYRGGRGAGL